MDRRRLLAGMAATAFAGGAARAGERHSQRPAPADRKFTSPAVDACILPTKARSKDPHLGWLFETCFPTTLDPTARVGDGDAFVIPGDIDAMWLRDSSAQVWPYLPLARGDDALVTLFRGLIARQARCILI